MKAKYSGEILLSMVDQSKHSNYINNDLKFQNISQTIILNDSFDSFGQDLHLFDKISWVGGKPPVAEPNCGFHGKKCISELNYIFIPIANIF